MADPDAAHWGRETQRQTGIRAGVLYPVLYRMLERGWLADGWEDVEDARAENRPPRRYYAVTAAGKTELSALLAAAREDSRFRHLFPGTTEEPTS